MSGRFDVGALELLLHVAKSEFANWAAIYRLYACGCVGMSWRGEYDSDPTGYAAARAGCRLEACGAFTAQSQTLQFSSSVTVWREGTLLLAPKYPLSLTLECSGFVCAVYNYWGEEGSLIETVGADARKETLY